MGDSNYNNPSHYQDDEYNYSVGGYVGGGGGGGKRKHDHIDDDDEEYQVDDLIADGDFETQGGKKRK